MSPSRGSIFEFARLGYYHFELDAYKKQVVKNKKELDEAIRKLQSVDERNKDIPLDQLGLYFQPKRHESTATHIVTSKAMQDKIEDMDYYARDADYGIMSVNEARTQMEYDDIRISTVDVRCEYCGGHTKAKNNCVNCGAPPRRIT